MPRATAAKLVTAALLAALRCGAAVCRTPDGADVCLTMVRESRVSFCEPSPSVSDAGWEQEKAFASVLYDNFEEKTANLTIYRFSAFPRVIVPFDSSFAEGKDILGDTDRLGFGTNILAAVETCGMALRPLEDGRQKLIVLMTDGSDESGNSDKELLEASATLKQQGVTISTIGISVSLSADCPCSTCPCPYDEELLKAMSSKNNDGGDLFYAITVDELPDEATDVTSEICDSGVGDLSTGLSTPAKAGIGVASVAAIGILAALVLVKVGVVGGGALGAGTLGTVIGGLASKGGAAAAAAGAAAGAGGDAGVGAAAPGGEAAVGVPTAGYEAAAAAGAAGVATIVRAIIQRPVPCVYSPSVTPRPESTTFSEPAEAPTVENSEDVEAPNLPDLPPMHLSIAIDTSKLGCSAEHADGDNRSAYASVIKKIQNVLVGPTLGQLQTSLVSFSGVAAGVPTAMAGEPVSEDPRVIQECISAIEPPPGADTKRASPYAAILAVNECIHLLRTTEMRFRALRRVLVLHAGGFSDAEFRTESARHRDGLGWTTSSCVVVAGVGKEFDSAAGVQLGCVALTCEEVEKLGNAEVLELLRLLIAAKNPRTLSSVQ